MKDFDEKPYATETQAPDEQKKLKFMAEMLSNPGLTVWEFDEETKILKEAIIKEVIVELSADYKKYLTPVSKETKRKIVVYRRNCLYFQALNKRNAYRKLEKLLS